MERDFGISDNWVVLNGARASWASERFRVAWSSWLQTGRYRCCCGAANWGLLTVLVHARGLKPGTRDESRYIYIYIYIYIWSILWCGQSGDHPQEDLAKFGYKHNIQVKILKTSLYIFGYILQQNKYKSGVQIFFGVILTMGNFYVLALIFLVSLFCYL